MNFDHFMMGCYRWLGEIHSKQNLTLDDINSYILLWNLGGISLISIIIPIGILGNSLILYIYATKYKPSNYRTYVLWLAVVDLLSSSFSMPYLLSGISSPVFLISEFFCKFGAVVTQFTSFSSGFTLIVIGIHRYRQICKATKWQITERQSIINCIIAQCVSIFFSWPAGILYGGNTVEIGISNYTRTYCSVDNEAKHLNLQGPYYILMNILIITTTLILVVLYFFVIKEIRNRKKVHSSISEETRKQSTNRTTVTLFIVSVAYCLTFAPHTVLRAVENIQSKFYCSLDFAGGFVFNTFIWSFLINNVINPFIYMYADKKFATEFKKLVCRSCRKTGDQIQAQQQNSTKGTHKDSTRETDC